MKIPIQLASSFWGFSLGRARNIPEGAYGSLAMFEKTPAIPRKNRTVYLDMIVQMIYADLPIQHAEFPVRCVKMIRSLIHPLYSMIFPLKNKVVRVLYTFVDTKHHTYSVNIPLTLTLHESSICSHQYSITCHEYSNHVSMIFH